jgi:hypothetical protein
MRRFLARGSDRAAFLAYLYVVLRCRSTSSSPELLYKTCNTEVFTILFHLHDLPVLIAHILHRMYRYLNASALNLSSRLLHTSSSLRISAILFINLESKILYAISQNLEYRAREGWQRLRSKYGRSPSFPFRTSPPIVSRTLVLSLR